MSAGSWFYVERGQAVGPVPFYHLSQMAAEGRLGANDLVCAEGSTAWQVAYAVPGLFRAPTAHAPPPPPTDSLNQLAAAQPGGQPGLNYGGYQYSGHYSNMQRGPSQQGMAIAGFVLSFLMPLLGLIFSAVALSGMKRNHNDEGKGFATAGLVISIVIMGLWCLWFGLMATVVGSMSGRG